MFASGSAKLFWCFASSFSPFSRSGWCRLGARFSHRFQRPISPSFPHTAPPGTGDPLGRRKRSPRKSRDETGPESAALSAPPRASRVAPYSAKPRKLCGKPALVSSLSRLAGLLGGGGSPERTGLLARWGYCPSSVATALRRKSGGGAGRTGARVVLLHRSGAPPLMVDEKPCGARKSTISSAVFNARWSGRFR